MSRSPRVPPRAPASCSTCRLKRVISGHRMFQTLHRRLTDVPWDSTYTFRRTRRRPLTLPMFRWLSCWPLILFNRLGSGGGVLRLRRRGFPTCEYTESAIWRTPRTDRIRETTRRASALSITSVTSDSCQRTNVSTPDIYKTLILARGW